MTTVLNPQFEVIEESNPTPYSDNMIQGGKYYFRIDSGMDTYVSYDLSIKSTITELLHSPQACTVTTTHSFNHLRSELERLCATTKYVIYRPGKHEMSRYYNAKYFAMVVSDIASQLDCELIVAPGFYRQGWLSVLSRKPTL